MKNLPHEFQALAILSANTILAGIKHVIIAVEPVLNPLLIALQIVIAVITIVWIWRRAKGAKLDNQQKERDLKNEQNT